MPAIPMLDEDEMLPPAPTTPCVISTVRSAASGYCQTSRNGKQGYAHRFAWMEERGPIPDGLTIDHLCRVKACVNVEHMELVTRAENTRRAGIWRGLNGRCQRHGPWDRRTPKGRRYCSICTSESNARRRAA